MLVKFSREHVAPLTSPIFFIDAVFKNNGIQTLWIQLGYTRADDNNVSIERRQLVEIVRARCRWFSNFSNISFYQLVSIGEERLVGRWLGRNRFIKTFLPRFFLPRNFSWGNKFESLATRIMDERYSAIAERGAGAKNRGPAEINHPSYFRIESSINHFPLPLPALCIIPSTKRDRGRAFTPTRLEKQSRNSTLDFHGIRSRDGSFQLFWYTRSTYTLLESLGNQANSKINVESTWLRDELNIDRVDCSSCVFSFGFSKKRRRNRNTFFFITRSRGGGFISFFWRVMIETARWKTAMDDGDHEL